MDGHFGWPQVGWPWFKQVSVHQIANGLYYTVMKT